MSDTSSGMRNWLVVWITFLFLASTLSVVAADGGTWTFGRVVVSILVIGAVSFLAFVAVVVYLFLRARRFVASAIQPDVPKLMQSAEKLRRRHPGISDEKLCRKLVHRQANRAGLVGFVTGVGGLPLLPFLVTIDVVATLRIQATLVRLIWLIYGEDGRKVIDELGLWAITAGSHRATTAGGVVLRQSLKSALKVFPLLGGVIGYALNWSSTQAIGRVALAKKARGESVVEEAGERS